MASLFILLRDFLTFGKRCSHCGTRLPHGTRSNGITYADGSTGREYTCNAQDNRDCYLANF